MALSIWCYDKQDRRNSFWTHALFYSHFYYILL